MDLNMLALMATILASLWLGLVAYVRAPDRPSNRLFGVNMLAVALWAFVTFLIQKSRDPAEIEFLLQVAHFLAAIVLCTLIDFFWVFPNQLRFGSWKPRLLLYASAVLVGIVAMSPSLVESVEVNNTGHVIHFGWPLIIMALYFTLLLIYANYVLLQKCRNQYGIARVQSIYVLVGGVATESCVIFVDIYLPLLTGNTSYSRWGVVACLIYAVAITTAIAKHRLWDLNGLARKIAAALLAVVSLVGVATLVLWILTRAGMPLAGTLVSTDLWLMLMGAVLGIALVPVYTSFRGLISRELQEERVRIMRLAKTLDEAILHAPLHAPPLLPILVEAQRFFEATLAEAYVRGADGVYRNAGTVLAYESPAVSCTRNLNKPLPEQVAQRLNADHLAEMLNRGQLVRFGAVDRVIGTLEVLEVLQAEVVLPLRWQEETIGLLILGPRLSRDMYTPSDLVLLDTVAAHAAIAVKNSELQSRILAEKERTEKVIAQMESGLIVIDAAQRIYAVNPAACLLLSKREEDLIGKDLSVLPPGLVRWLQAVVEQGQTTSGARSLLGDRGEIPVACSTFALHGPRDELEGVGIVLHDLRTEEALRRAEQEAQKLHLIRALAAGMAHEIRNPLVAIRTFAELAPTRLDDPEFRESFLKVARSEVNRLEELVSQFLILARPASMVHEPVSIKSLLEALARALSGMAEARGISLSVKVPANCPSVLGDEARLHQAVANVVLNALEAAPEGGRVELRAELVEKEPADARQVTIEVWNSGSYIAPEDRERIFEPFFTSKSTGTGLGLSICHTIIEQHGGRVNVESDEEAGTVFIIRLPVAVDQVSTTVTAP